MSSGNDKETISRLCNEIQLFDLCDLESCSFKNGRFCTNKELLARFETIKEEDDRPAIVYEDEELDDDPDFPNDYGESGIEENDEE